MKIFEMCRSGHVLNEERGQPLIETALLFPMLLLILLGIGDLGWMAYNYIELTNAANSGAHYAAQSVTYATQTSSIQAAMNNDAANMTSISPAVSMACTCSDGTKKNSDGSTPSCTKYDGCTTPARLIDTVTVTATKTVNPLIPWPGVPSSVTMRSSAAMQVQKGSSSGSFSGIIYAPSAQLYLQDNGGGITLNSDLIVGTLFDKASTMNLTSYTQTNPTNSPLTQVVLVE